jgi:hypothetical protein
VDDAELLRTAADRLESLASRSTPGDWRIGGLLATRPEVIAHALDGSTRHVAEARADSARWIAALSPAVGEPLAAWLRAATDDPRPEALALAKLLVSALPDR